MAREVRRYQVTVPTGTKSTAPQRTVLTMPARKITRITCRVPPGPRGAMGFVLANAGTPMIPVERGEWLIADDETLTFDLQGYVTSGTWDVLAYNEGAFPHTVYFTFSCTPTGPTRVPVRQAIAGTSLGTSTPAATTSATPATGASTGQAPTSVVTPPPTVPVTVPITTPPVTPVPAAPGTGGPTAPFPTLPPPPTFPTVP